MRKRPWMLLILTLACIVGMTFGLAAIAVAAPPAAPSNLHQVGIEATSVKIAWTDNFSGEDGFEIYRAPEGTYTWTLAGVVGENVTEFKDLGLSPDTSYSYVVTCYSGATSSDYSNQILVHTPVPLAAPSGLTAVYNPTYRCVELQWADNSLNEQFFRIDRKIGDGSFSNRVAIGAGAVYFTDEDVTSGATYSYRVQAANDTSVSEWSNIATITIPTVSVEVPTGLAATYNGSYVGLIWNDVATEDRYQIDRSLGADPPSMLAETGTNVYFYHDSTVTPGSTYQYRVRIGSGSIFGEWTAPVSITIPGVAAVAPPSGLTAAANAAGNGIVLSWTDNSTDEIQFQINRRVSDGLDVYLGATAANITTYTDATAAPGITYRYKIRAVRGPASSDWTSEVTASLPVASAETVPAAPSSLAALASGASINLTWRDNSSNESAFILERKSGVGTYAEIATLSPNAVSYSDRTAPGGTSLAYRLRAYNSAGYSSYSNESSINVTVVGPPIAPSTQKVIRLYINKTEYYVNDELLAMDSAPIIKQGRTLLPIRYVATPLGATVEWDAAAKKVTVKLNGTVIEMWIGKNKSKVNGVEKPIDPDNSTVSPVVVPPGRTMLPLRFIAENLGCQVIWNQALNEVKVVYPKTTN